MSPSSSCKHTCLRQEAERSYVQSPQETACPGSAHGNLLSPTLDMQMSLEQGARVESLMVRVMDSRSTSCLNPSPSTYTELACASDATGKVN